MRFAGQRFRSQRHGMPKQRAQSGYVADFTATPTVQGIESPMTAMPEKNVQSMAFTAMPEMGERPFTIPEFNEPSFQARGRI